MIPEGKVLTVCHDAGGANIISSFLRLNKIEYSISADGPAKDIFRGKIGSYENVNFEDAINNVEWVLTGTSINSDLECNAIKYAKKVGKKCITFLDHWANYKERFQWHGLESYPDEIWVGDIDAYKKANAIFNKTVVKLHKNPYWEEIRRDFSKHRNEYDASTYKIVIASTNIDSLKTRNNNIMISDYEILSKVLNKIYNLKKVKFIKEIILSLHPGEKKDKYKDFNFKCYPFKIKINKDKEPLELLRNSTHVIGCDSMLLVIGKLMGKKTINIGINSNNFKLIPQSFIDIIWE